MTDYIVKAGADTYEIFDPTEPFEVLGVLPDCPTDPKTFLEWMGRELGFDISWE